VCKLYDPIQYSEMTKKIEGYIFATLMRGCDVENNGSTSLCSQGVRHVGVDGVGLHLRTVATSGYIVRPSGDI
jgi:hypothetical protein